MNKWPRFITAIRHVKSEYNAVVRVEVPGYPEFLQRFNAEYKKLDLVAVLNGTFPSAELKKMALELAPKLAAQKSDYDTNIAPGAIHQAIQTGKELPQHMELPDTIYVSP